MAVLLNNGRHSENWESSSYEILLESSSCGGTPNHPEAINQQNNLNTINDYNEQQRIRSNDVDIENGFDSAPQQVQPKSRRFYKLPRAVWHAFCSKLPSLPVGRVLSKLRAAFSWCQHSPHSSKFEDDVVPSEVIAPSQQSHNSSARRSEQDVLSRGKESSHSMLNKVTPAAIQAGRRVAHTGRRRKCLKFQCLKQIFWYLTFLRMPGLVVGLAPNRSSGMKQELRDTKSEDADIHCAMFIWCGLNWLVLITCWMLGFGGANSFNMGLGPRADVRPQAIPDDVYPDPYPTSILGLGDGASIHPASAVSGPNPPQPYSPADKYKAFFDPRPPIECDDRPATSRPVTETVQVFPQHKARDMVADEGKLLAMVITPGNMLKLSSVDIAAANNELQGRLHDQFDHIGHHMGSLRDNSCLLGEVLPLPDSHDISVVESKEDVRKRRCHVQEQAHEKLQAQVTPEGHFLPSAFICSKWTISLDGDATFAANPRWVTELVVPAFVNNSNIAVACKERRDGPVFQLGSPRPRVFHCMAGTD